MTIEMVRKEEKVNILKTIKILLKVINKKRKKQLFLLFLIMLISGLAEVFSLASLIPFLSILSNPEILTNNYLINALPHNFNYIPKIYFKLGVDEIYKESKILHSQYSNVFVTTHPTKGLDWMLNVWLKYIHPKVPWAELHIYYKLLYHNTNFNFLI